MSRSRAPSSSGRALPDFVPQLATLAKDPPTGDDWLHEQKLDGYRIGCRVDAGKVRLISRAGLDWTEKFPGIRDAAKRLPVEQALLDGEAAAVLPSGLTSFQALQNSFRGDASVPVIYFAFDLLFWNGRDVGQQPLRERKALLKQLLASHGGNVIRYSDHVTGDGAAFLRGACGMGMEGIVSKRKDQAYTPGRNSGWLKIKCIKRQELVIGGFTDPEGSRRGIGALLVGYYDDEKRLVFAGRVGTGFTEQVALDLRRQLDGLERKQPTFVAGPLVGLPKKGLHWTAPKLVCEVAFAEWTGDGSLRHPSFQGLRLDKNPTDVVREIPG
ncbi:MAG TPA: non-homologous end-joining DNA ligase [Polyangia bacterium]|jgi:bifunctional non-homologous end joining protein LigD